MNSEIRLPIDSVTRRLADLDATERVAGYARENETELTETIVSGFNQAINRFNEFNAGSFELMFMPKSEALLDALRAEPIPRLENLPPRDIMSGIKEAQDPMLAGQKIKTGELENTPANNAYAIRTPSMDTSDEALAVGTAGHILERSLFSYFKKLGIDGINGKWSKDDILFVIKECSLLVEAEYQDGLTAEGSILFPVLTTSNDEGGLDWGSTEYVNNFMLGYHDIFDDKIYIKPTMIKSESQGFRQGILRKIGRD